MLKRPPAIKTFSQVLILATLGCLRNVKVSAGYTAASIRHEGLKIIVGRKFVAWRFVRAHRDFYLRFTEESINRDLYKCFVIIEEKWEQHPVRLLYEKTYFFT